MIDVKKVNKSLQCKACCVGRESVHIDITGDYMYSRGVLLCDSCAKELLNKLTIYCKEKDE